MRTVRDVATVAAGLACIFSQILIHFQSSGKVEPNVALVTAGVGLLTSWPLMRLGDRRTDGEADNGKGR
jgi:hypothetical protein